MSQNAGAHAAAHPGRAAEAERRQLTVMFVDLVGSTELTRGSIRRTWAVDPGLSGHGAGEITRDGQVAKYMGDGVLAYFGWPGRTRTRPSGRSAPA